MQQVQEISGPWSVTFDPRWGGPGRVTFNQLEDWTTPPDDGIRVDGTLNDATDTDRGWVTEIAIPWSDRERDFKINC